jgi:hypothetical protein
VQYMLLVYQDENALNEAERNECYRESTALTHELSASGHYLAAAPLHPTSTASTVQVREGRRMVTDGPFAETREQLGGYFLVEAADVDEALSIAARIPGARYGTIEVRPVVALAGMPAK